MYQNTSAEAYVIVSQQLGERQKEVLHAFEKNGPMTNTEVSRILNIPINAITPRTNELVKLKRVVELGKRSCRITGRKAIVWGIEKRDLFSSL